MRGRGAELAVVACLVVVLIVGIFVRLPFLGWQCDDAMITFRYAQNLGRGNGFLYNPGERVLGTSTPLFTILLGIPALLRISVPVAANWLNIACQIIACLLGYAILGREGGSAAGIGGALVLAFAPEVLMSAGMGMETPLYVMLLLSCIACYSSGWYRLCWAMCGLLTLTRPEGLLMPVILLSDVVMHGREGRARLRGFYVFATIVAAWCLFSFVYFGSLIPSSALAKFTVYAQKSTPLAERMKYFMSFDNPPIQLYALPFFLIASLDLLMRRSKLVILLVWLVGYILPLAFSRTCIFIWYYTPAITVYLLVAVLGVSLVVRRLWGYVAESRIGSMVAGLLLVVISVLTASGWISAIGKRHAMAVATYHKYAERHVLAGEWLKDNTPQGAVVCASDIGYLGFISERRILDYVGLVSPESIGFNKRRDWLGLFKKRRPDYVAASSYALLRRVVMRAPWFKEHYTLSTTIRSKGATEYYIFKRLDGVPESRDGG